MGSGLRVGARKRMSLPYLGCYELQGSWPLRTGPCAIRFMSLHDSRIAHRDHEPTWTNLCCICNTNLSNRLLGFMESSHDRAVNGGARLRRALIAVVVGSGLDGVSPHAGIASRARFYRQNDRGILRNSSDT